MAILGQSSAIHFYHYWGCLYKKRKVRTKQHNKKEKKTLKQTISANSKEKMSVLK